MPLTHLGAMAYTGRPWVVYIERLRVAHIGRLRVAHTRRSCMDHYNPVNDILCPYGRRAAARQLKLCAVF